MAPGGGVPPPGHLNPKEPPHAEGTWPFLLCREQSGLMQAKRMGWEDGAPTGHLLCASQGHARVMETG